MATLTRTVWSVDSEIILPDFLLIMLGTRKLKLFVESRCMGGELNIDLPILGNV